MGEEEGIVMTSVLVVVMFVDVRARDRMRVAHCARARGEKVCRVALAVVFLLVYKLL